MVMLRILEKVARRPPMMGPHVVAMRKMVEDVAVSSNETSVNAPANRLIMAMAAMVNQKIMRILILKIMGQDAAEIHVFVHETGQAKPAKTVVRLNKTNNANEETSMTSRNVYAESWILK